MQTEQQAPDRAWLRTIPYSQVDYPKSAAGTLKNRFWQAYIPLHYVLRNSLVTFNVFKQGRPEDFLGMIAPHLSAEEFVAFLVEKGYGNHFVAWKFKGELVSLRYVENFSHQYHIRIFKDGKVCGHYERTPESHPVRHMKDFLYMKIKRLGRESGIENRPEYFRELLGDRIIPEESE